MLGDSVGSFGKKKTGHNWDILLEGSIDYPFPPTIMEVKHGVLEDV